MNTEQEEKQIKMFGMTTQDIQKMVDATLTLNRDTRMMIMGMLSDIQEKIDNEEIRQSLNIAKYLVDTTLTGVAR